MPWRNDIMTRALVETTSGVEALGQEEGPATPALPQMTPADASSNYGSDVDVTTPAPSEYGPEFDAEEERLIEGLLHHGDSAVPSEHTIVYPTKDEDGRDDSAPTVLIHSSPPSAVVRLQKGAAVELEAKCADRTSTVELDGDGPSAGSRDGYLPETPRDIYILIH